MTSFRSTKQNTVGRQRLAVFLGAALTAIASGQSAIAEDTEVFFSAAAAAGETAIRPNVLFVLDTSSSMNNDVPGTGKNRLENMKDALVQILTESNNVNVGLMRFHDKGGPVLFPVTYIDEALTSIAGEVSGTIARQAEGSGDDASQRSPSNVVSVDSETLILGNVPSGTPVTKRYQVEGDLNDLEEYVSSGNVDEGSSDLEFADENSGNLQEIGMRFQNVDIPQGATILNAQLILHIDEERNGDTDITIFAQNSINPAEFRNVRFDISSRPRTTGINIGNLPTAEPNQTITTANFAGVVQQIVDLPGWNQQSLVLIATGTGRRTVDSHDGSANRAPILEVTYLAGPSGTDEQTVGVRFSQVDVPQGATITSAFIDFSASSATSSSALSVEISGIDKDDATAFQGTSNELGDSASPPTTEVVDWSNIPAWNTEDELQQTPNLKDIVQEIVDRPGWCGGNGMAFKFEVTSGNGQRVAKSFDDSPGVAPRLNLVYEPDSIPAGGGCINQTLVRQIATENDDAEEKVDSGNIDLSSSDLEIVRENGDQVIGIRFQDIDIAQGANILSARLEFFTDRASSRGTALTIRGEDVDNALIFDNDNRNISSRNTTSNSVPWSPPPWEVVDEIQLSPDVSTIVQEIVDRGGWQSGNAMAFVISGSGLRAARSYKHSPANGARLRIQVQGGSGNEPPTPETVRSRLIEVVNELEYKSGTPIVSTMAEAARYYRGDTVFYGKTRGAGETLDSGGSLNRSEFSRTSHPASYSGATSTLPDGCTTDNLSSNNCRREVIDDATARYISPIEQSCQANYMVLLSDGNPSRRHAINDGLLPSMLGAGASCERPSDDDDEECGRELVRFMQNEDQIDTLDGDQIINTYTIGFNFGGQGFLQDLAAEGGGAFFTANTAAELAEVFKSILAEILAKNTTFVAPAVTINTFNRLTTREELYFALFRPSNDSKWEGNLKQYIFGADGVIRDDDGDPAVNPNTGFFRDDARSLFSLPLNQADGGDVALGGFASNLTTNRTIYTYIGNSPSEVILTGNSNRLLESNDAITLARLGIEGQTDEYRTSLLQWARGIDVNDDDEDGSTVDARRSIGDPLHSEPVLVTYGGTAADPDITIFFGTNEGFLHAVDDNMTERFSFIPQEFLRNLDTFFRDIGGVHPYGLDGPITSLVDAGPDGIVAGADGDRAWLFVGSRRGGRNYYALDVTNRDLPVLKWRITGGSTDYEELGQTWSVAQPVKINVDGTATEVLIFGGGYDDGQDSAGVATSDSVGRAIYIADANTGARIWWAGPAGGPGGEPDLEIAAMSNSIPGDVRAIDLDDDGLIDRLYAADTRGQIIRIDIDLENTGADDLATGGVIAQLGGIDSATDNRRFYVSPDVAKFSDSGDIDVDPFLSIALGTGYRAHPLDTIIDDRFYVLRDPDVSPNSSTLLTRTQAPNSPLTEANLLDITDNVIGEGNEADRNAQIDALEAADGFLLRLNAGAGEKVLNGSRTFDGQVIFSSFTPGAGSNNSCQASQGQSRLYVIDAITGAPTKNLFTVDDNNDLTAADRAVELQQTGLPPDPTILFPESDVEGVLSDEAFVCIGPECLDLDLSLDVEKTSWQEQQ